MATSKRTKRAAANAAANIRKAAQADRAIDPALRADLDRRRSGAARPHQDSGMRRHQPAGRAARMGSRRARAHAAMADY